MIEAAVLNISRGEVEEMVVAKKWGSISLRAITTRISRAMVILVLMTNLVNVVGPILAGAKAIALYGDQSIVVMITILTVATILFSEIIPKSLGTHYAPLVSRYTAPIIQGLIYALYPMVICIEWIVSLFNTGHRRIGTEAQIRSLATLGHRAGHIESDERQLIHRAFILNDKMAADIMTPLKDIVSLEATATVRHAAQHVLHMGYSRYPVFGKSADDVKGMILARDILEAVTEERQTESISSLVRPILVFCADQAADELLVLFRDRRIHLAIVQEGEKTVGLVTLEDVLEELVGEIEDEKDTDQQQSSSSQCKHLRSTGRIQTRLQHAYEL